MDKEYKITISDGAAGLLVAVAILTYDGVPFLCVNGELIFRTPDEIKTAGRILDNYDFDDNIGYDIP